MAQLLITIDGPAGAGKTTVSKKIAERLGYRYIDTGALYRGVAIAAIKYGIDPENDIELRDLCQRLQLRFVLRANGLRLLLDEEDITDQLRTPEITMQASAVSAKPVVRSALLDLQRKIGEEKGVVFEGRDMGTVVFPEADAKFFLTASQETRAKRRYEELNTTSAITFEAVRQDMTKRDANDSTRALAPLKPAEDAVHIDATQLSINEVVELMLSHIQK